MESHVDHDERHSAAHHARVKVRLLPAGEPAVLRIERAATLLELLVQAAEALQVALLPNAEAPLDTLHNLASRDRDVLIQDLEQGVGEYLRLPRTTHDFGVQLERVLFVNAQARVAPKSSMSPREVLALFGLDTNYTLYRPDSGESLPLDTEIAVERGLRLEAQRDGKYGGAPVTAPLPVLERALTELREYGYEARLVSHAGQRYVRVDGVPAPTPPWERSRHDVLIALPGAYEHGAALDAFYLAQPSSYAGHQHQRVGNAGNPLTLEGVTWLLVSWHYADGTAWRYPQDNVFTHMLHCQRFFTQAEA